MTDNDLLQAMSDLFDEKLQPIESDMTDTKSNIANLTNSVDIIKNEIRNIQLTLENETNRNIMRIAEGHLDLSRKLNEALEIDSEKEMLALRVNVLENQLRQIKDRLATIA